jgi:putative ABC transport system permease protein
MQVLPILSSLRRHRTAATLIIIEIALSCAIVCNTIFLIEERIAAMRRDSGVAEKELVAVNLGLLGDAAPDRDLVAREIAALRALPGVRSVSPSNMLPFWNALSRNSDVSVDRDRADAPRLNAAIYMGGPALTATLGLRIVAGRDFSADELVSYEKQRTGAAQVPAVLVTRAVAERLFPGQEAVGKMVNITGPSAQRVIGVVDALARPNDGNGIENSAFAVVLPVVIESPTAYVLRVEPSRRAEIVAGLDRALRAVHPDRIILASGSYTDLRDDFFKQDQSMAYLLAGLTAGLLIVTALGVVGLVSFWVQRRTRQIGTRRALGATRADILRYFLLENFLLASVGIVIGMALAYGINLWLMSTYEVARLPARYLPIGALTLWTLGQLAVLGPALRAAKISPAIATRSV